MFRVDSCVMRVHADSEGGSTGWQVSLAGVLPSSSTPWKCWRHFQQKLLKMNAPISTKKCQKPSHKSLLKTLLCIINRSKILRNAKRTRAKYSVSRVRRVGSGRLWQALWICREGFVKHDSWMSKSSLAIANFPSHFSNFVNHALKQIHPICENTVKLQSWPPAFLLLSNRGRSWNSCWWNTCRELKPTRFYEMCVRSFVYRIFN